MSPQMGYIYERFYVPQWAQHSAEKYDPLSFSDGVLVSLSPPPDLPTLRPRLDDPQFRRGGDHMRCQRRRGLLYGRTTAREASQRFRPGQAAMRNLIVSKYGVGRWVEVIAAAIQWGPTRHGKIK